MVISKSHGRIRKNEHLKQTKDNGQKFQRASLPA